MFIANHDLNFQVDSWVLDEINGYLSNLDSGDKPIAAENLMIALNQTHKLIKQLKPFSKFTLY